jgi:hypothetical protein
MTNSLAISRSELERDFNQVGPGARVYGGTALAKPEFNLSNQCWEVRIRTTAGVVLTRTIAAIRVTELTWQGDVPYGQVGAGTPLEDGSVAQEPPRGGLVAVKYRRDGATVRISLARAGIAEPESERG